MAAKLYQEGGGVSAGAGAVPGDMIFMGIRTASLCLQFSKIGGNLMRDGRREAKLPHEKVWGRTRRSKAEKREVDTGGDLNKTLLVQICGPVYVPKIKDYFEVGSYCKKNL